MLPAVFGGASAAIADELERAGEAAGQAGRQALSSSQVPQWSNVQVPSGLKAPTEVANLFSGSDGVNPLLLLGAVASIAIPVLLFQVGHFPPIAVQCACRFAYIDVYSDAWRRIEPGALSMQHMQCL